MTKGTPRVFLVIGSVSFLAVALLMVTMFAHPPQTGAQEQGASVELTPNFRLASTGQQFGIFVEAENLQHEGLISYDDDRDTEPDRFLPSEGMGAFEFTIQYDPAVLAIEGAEQGPQIEESARGFQCLQRSDEPGSFSLGCFSPGSDPGVSADLTLATVTFRPLGPGSTYLELEAELAGPLGDDIPVAVEGGLVQVSGGSNEDPDAVATRTAPGPRVDGKTATPPPAPGDGQQSTPGSTGMTTPTEDGETVRLGEEEGTPSLNGAEGSEAPDDSPDSAGDSEAQSAGSSDSRGSSPWRVALWSLGGVGAIAAAVAVGFAAMRWQRNR